MKLALGTVQFGLSYGISNRNGRPPTQEVRRILDGARRVGVGLLDTAHQYGESERVLGEALTSSDRFAIVTKTPALRQCADATAAAAAVEAALHQSLRQLRVGAVYALLVHNVADLLGSYGASVFARMQALRDQGLVQKLGVSVYASDDAEQARARFPVDVVQLPLSVIDQRALRSGGLTRLRAAGVEIHARSAFLQGVLLMAPDALPPHLAPVRESLRRYRGMLADVGLTPLQGALRFVRDVPQVDRVVVGVTTAAEFDEVAAAFAGPLVDLPEVGSFAATDPVVINPSLWPA